MKIPINIFFTVLLTQVFTCQVKGMIYPGDSLLPDNLEIVNEIDDDFFIEANPAPEKILDSIIYYMHENEDSIPFRAELYLYNDKGQITSYLIGIDDHFRSSEDILFRTKYEYEYDELGRNLRTIRYGRRYRVTNEEVVIDRWDPSGQHEYFYNSENLIDSMVYSYTNDSIWSLNEWTKYSYDTSNKLISKDKYTVKGGYELRRYYYYPNDVLPDSLYIENYIYPGYRPKMLYICKLRYNQTGKRVSWDQYQMDSASLALTPYVKDEIKYNESDKVTSRIVYTGNIQSMNWDTSFITKYHLDSDGDPIYEGRYYRDRVVPEFRLYSSLIYYYRRFVPVVDIPLGLYTFSIFPTLTVSKLTLYRERGFSDECNYNIIDKQGKIIQSGILEQGHIHELNVSGLSPGLYIIQVGNKHEGGSRKFIKH